MAFIGPIKIALPWQAARGASQGVGGCTDEPEGWVVTESAVSPAHLSWALHLLRANIDTAGQAGRQAGHAGRGLGGEEGGARSPPDERQSRALMGLMRASSPGDSRHAEPRGRAGRRCSLNLPWNNTSCRFPPTCLAHFAAPGRAGRSGSGSPARPAQVCGRAGRRRCKAATSWSGSQPESSWQRAAPLRPLADPGTGPRLPLVGQEEAGTFRSRLGRNRPALTLPGPCPETGLSGASQSHRLAGTSGWPSAGRTSAAQRGKPHPGARPRSGRLACSGPSPALPGRGPRAWLGISH